jgi:hypothetical protein
MAKWRGFIFLWLIFSAFSTVIAIIRFAQRVILVGWESEIFSGWRLFVYPPIAAGIAVALLGWLVLHYKSPPPRKSELD